MIKKIDNNNISKLIVINIIILILTIVGQYLYNELSIFLIMFKISPLIFILIYILLFIKSVCVIIENPKKVFRWIPLFILILIIGINVLYNYSHEKNLYKNNLVEGNKVVNDILNKEKYTTSVYTETLKNNSKLSCNGKVYIHRNTDIDALIEFCISFGFPDGGSSLIYSTGDEEYIKKYINSINKIKKMDNNWYYVYFE